MSGDCTTLNWISYSSVTCTFTIEKLVYEFGVMNRNLVSFCFYCPHICTNTYKCTNIQTNNICGMREGVTRQYEETMNICSYLILDKQIRSVLTCTIRVFTLYYISHLDTCSSLLILVYVLSINISLYIANHRM